MEQFIDHIQVITNTGAQNLKRQKSYYLSTASPVLLKQSNNLKEKEGLHY